MIGGKFVWGDRHSLSIGLRKTVNPCLEIKGNSVFRIMIRSNRIVERYRQIYINWGRCGN